MDPGGPGFIPGFLQNARPVLTRIRKEFNTGAYLACKAGISLFPYDNDTLIIYPYVTSQAQPLTVYLHVAGEARSLEMPVRKSSPAGEPSRISPLYTRDGETVFELTAVPGRYELYRIIR